MVGERIIFNRWLHPYVNEERNIVTSSPGKKEVLSYFGIPTEPDSIKIGVVVKHERLHDEQNGNGVLVRWYPSQEPYPLTVAKAKASALQKILHPNQHGHIVTDSTWTVHCPNTNISFNKPDTPNRQIEVIHALSSMRGCPISSDTGVVILPGKGRPLESYYFSLVIGSISPRLDIGVLANLVQANSGNSAGLSMLEALSSGIISPNDFAHLTVIKVDRGLYGGRLVDKKLFSHLISVDATNYQWLRAMSLGILPRY